jgi:hypothetical protein
MPANGCDWDGFSGGKWFRIVGFESEVAMFWLFGGRAVMASIFPK